VGKRAFKILLPTVLIVVLLIIAFRLAGFRPMKCPSDAGRSMYPTISPGDIWLCRMKRGYSPKDLKRGMVIFFPRENFEFLLSKRIIALENQTVALNEQGTFVNGEKIHESYAFHSAEKPSGVNRPHLNSEVETMKVPPGKLFVMGDNRDNSFDSRDPEFGLVDVKDIVGHYLMVLWARDKSKIGRLIK